MIARRQLPVASPIPALGLARAATALVAPSGRASVAVAATLAARYGATAVTLTDSGTSALVVALRTVVGAGRTVAYPAYACVDLIAAALRANVRVRLYDVDPITLSPDLDSLRRVVDDGVDAVLVAHLYGFPIDVSAVRSALAGRDIPLVEDAAQAADGTLHGVRAGGLGDVTVLSFGRGKGTTAGHGGALLAIGQRWHDPVVTAAHRLPAPARGTSALIGATASWVLGRPSVYGIPAAIPGLHLGETVYHDAGEPAALSAAAAALLGTTLAMGDAHAVMRARTAAALRALLDAVRNTNVRVRACEPVSGAVPGYLRFPVLASAVSAAPELGIVRAYPRPLSDHPALQPVLHPVREPLLGARELATSLMTLPTHHMVTRHDLDSIAAWLRTV